MVCGWRCQYSCERARERPCRRSGGESRRDGLADKFARGIRMLLVVVVQLFRRPSESSGSTQLHLFNARAEKMTLVQHMTLFSHGKHPQKGNAVALLASGESCLTICKAALLIPEYVPPSLASVIVDSAAPCPGTLARGTHRW
jgi:hypothetical protein